MMKTFKLFTAIVLLALCSSWATPPTEVLELNSSEKTLAKLLKDYKKMSSVKILNKNETAKFNKKKMKPHQLKASQVGVVQYKTKKNTLEKVYVLDIDGILAYLSTAGNLGDSVSYGQDDDDDDGGDEPEEECEIITNTCHLDTCTCFCVVSNSCDPSGESDPNCCDDCSCGEGDDITTSFDDFMETLGA